MVRTILGYCIARRRDKDCRSYLTAASELPACFRLPSAFLLLNADLGCCLPEPGNVAFEALPSLLGVPLVNVVDILVDRFPSSPTTGAELPQDCMSP